jgi:hypothetical protein
MGKRDDLDLSAEQQAARARFEQSARWVESTAIELVPKLLCTAVTS